MGTRNTGGSGHILRVFAFLLLVAFILQVVSGCASSSQQSSLATTPASSPIGPQAIPASKQPSPTPPLQTAGLQGPTNFLLNTPLNFSDVSGATVDDNQTITPLDANSVKKEITGEMKRLLFVVDSNNDVKVYSPGVSPAAVKVTPNADGSVAINYKQAVDSDAGTVTITFEGTLIKKQIKVTYQQQYAPSILINAQTSAVAVTFTAQVRQVAAKEIPAAPKDGAYQLAGNGGIVIAWSAGQNTVAYDVYRQISDRDQQFQLLARVKSTSYADNSPEAIQNVHSKKGITYAVFSVGPTSVENPGGLVIPVSA